MLFLFLGLYLYTPCYMYFRHGAWLPGDYNPPESFFYMSLNNTAKSKPKYFKLLLKGPAGMIDKNREVENFVLPIL